MSDDPEVWVDHDYPPIKRQYEQCETCGGDKILRHHCLIEEWFIPTFRDDRGNPRGFQQFSTLESAQKWAEFWEPKPPIYSRWVSPYEQVAG